MICFITNQLSCNFNLIQSFVFFILLISERDLKPFKLYKNRKDGINLYYNGYVYRRKAYFRNSINWVCAKAPYRDANQKLVCCPGRCVTSENGTIKLSKKRHIHEPVFSFELNELDCKFVIDKDIM